MKKGWTSIDEIAGRDQREVVIPDGYAKIGDEAFKDCTLLEKVVIPRSVIKIGYRAFQNCTSLTGVVIPRSVLEIKEEAFYGCTSLASVEICNSFLENAAHVYKDVAPASIGILLSAAAHIA